MFSSTHRQILTYIRTHISQCIHGSKGSHSHPYSHCYLHAQESSKVHHTALPSLTSSQTPTHPHTHRCIIRVTYCHTHANMHSHKHSHMVGRAHRFTQTHTQLQIPRGHTSSPIVSKCCWFSLICRLYVCQSLWLPLSLFPTLSLFLLGGR